MEHAFSPPPSSGSVTHFLERLRRTGSLLMTAPSPGNLAEWKLFSRPVRILQADTPDEVAPLLGKLQDWTDRGFYAAGFFSYEAGAAFEPELYMKPAPGFPLIQLALFDREPEAVNLPEFRDCPPLSDCIPELTQAEYAAAFAEIHRNITAGNLYQANLTFRAAFADDVPAEELFLSLYTRHPVPYAAFLHFDGRKIVSLSPELFLESDGHHIFSTPMKGTAKRLPAPDDDCRMAQWLANDDKNRAENLMITDMVRNDLGRACRPGSVTVNPLFHVDTYRTVHQMVSTVHGELRAGTDLYQILQAAYPPASITGAPKISAVNLIAAVEKSPRRIYTGSIGCFLPGRRFRLNVAIRTLLFENGQIETGIGGGVIYDSTAEDEWREALLKCRYANAGDPAFQIFETMLWTPRGGFHFQQEHIRRAVAGQRYFGRACEPSALEAELARLRAVLAVNPAYSGGACVKIILSADGSVESRISPPRLPDWSRTPLKLQISSRRVDSTDLFLYHKTTNRQFFDDNLKEARARGFHEVVFLNEKEALTQGSISNLFLRRNGVWYTPAVANGLLPGIWRAHAIALFHAREACLTVSELLQADEVIIGNSLRGAGKVAAISVQ